MSEPAVETAIAPTAEPTSSPPVPALRREAILPRERRGGLGAVALLCSLAGVASGFALATTILATQIAQSEARMARRAAFEQGVVRERPFLGVEYIDSDGSARVVRVFGGTPASQIGLRPGDRIVRFDAEPIDHYGELGRVVRASSIGHEATLDVRRGSSMMTFHPTLIGRYMPDNH
jgi:S1-C subfamily serine protease